MVIDKSEESETPAVACAGNSQPVGIILHLLAVSVSWCPAHCHLRMCSFGKYWQDCCQHAFKTQSARPVETRPYVMCFWTTSVKQQASQFPNSALSLPFKMLQLFLFLFFSQMISQLLMQQSQLLHSYRFGQKKRTVSKAKMLAIITLLLQLQQFYWSIQE